MIQPIGKQVAVERIAEPATRGMIAIPEFYLKFELWGRVVAVGGDVIDVKPGDIVLLSENIQARRMQEHDDKTLTFVSEEELLAIREQ